jgi:hypothetical protein
MALAFYVCIIGHALVYGIFSGHPTAGLRSLVIPTEIYAVAGARAVVIGLVIICTSFQTDWCTAVVARRFGFRAAGFRGMASTGGGHVAGSYKRHWIVTKWISSTAWLWLVWWAVTCVVHRLIVEGIYFLEMKCWSFVFWLSNNEKPISKMSYMSKKD